MDSYSRAAKKNTSQRNEVLRQDTMHLIERPRYQQGSLCQNHLARHSQRRKKTRQTEEEVGRQHQEMNRSGVRQVPEGSGEQGKMKETGCEIICGAPTTLAVKG